MVTDLNVTGFEMVTDLNVKGPNLFLRQIFIEWIHNRSLTFMSNIFPFCCVFRLNLHRLFSPRFSIWYVMCKVQISLAQFMNAHFAQFISPRLSVFQFEF
jgi:hypothetical protein